MPRELPLHDPTPPRVLVVDDDAGVVRFVVACLTEDDCHVSAVGTVEAALEALTTGSFDVVLVDLMLPERNGLDLLQEIITRELGVISVLVTGTTDMGQVVEGMKRGAFDCLTKPVSVDAIKLTVRRAATVGRTKRRELALERVASDWQATFDVVPDAMLVLDSSHVIIRANRAAAAWAVPHLDLIGHPLTAVSPACAEAVFSNPTRLGEAGIRVFDPERGVHLLVSISTLPPAAAPAEMVVIARDVTEEVRVQSIKTHLLRQLVTAQEDERGRLARELHDGIGQWLSSLVVGLTLAADRPTVPDHKERLSHLARVAAEAADEVRRLAHGLRPSVLDDLGLVAALGRLADDFTRLHGVRAELVVVNPPPVRPSAEVETTAFRIAQEALTNVARHAAAKTVDVVIDCGADALKLSVVDDGIGLDVGRLDGDSTSGIGLRDMRERVAHLDGRIRIHSEPGRGTTVDVTLPLTGDRT